MQTLGKRILASEYEFDLFVSVTLVVFVISSIFSEDAIPKALSAFECFLSISLQERKWGLKQCSHFTESKTES